MYVILLPGSRQQGEQVREIQRRNLQSSSGVQRNPDMSVMGAVRIKERRSSQKYLVVTKPFECAD